MADETQALMARLNAGPDNVELTPEELALLRAYLKRAVPLNEAGQKQVSDAKLKLIRDYNLNLRATRDAQRQPADQFQGAYDCANRVIQLASAILLYVARPSSVDDAVAKHLVTLIKQLADCLAQLEDGRKALRGLLPLDRVNLGGQWARNVLEALEEVGWSLLQALESTLDPIQLAQRFGSGGGEFRPQTMLDNWERLTVANESGTFDELQGIDWRKTRLDLEIEREQVAQAQLAVMQPTTDPCQAFLTLAHEIVARIETHKVGDWWARIVHLAHELEAERLRLPDPDLSSHSRIAIHISDRWDGDNRVSTLTVCDPSGLTGNASSLLRLSADETKQRTLQTMGDWIRAVERLVAEQSKPQVAGIGGNPVDDDYTELRQWVESNLKGGQRRLVKCLIDKSGTMPIADLQVDTNIEDVNRTRNHVKSKLAKAGWLIERHDNEFRLVPNSRHK